MSEGLRRAHRYQRSLAQCSQHTVVSGPGSNEPIGAPPVAGQLPPFGVTLTTAESSEPTVAHVTGSEAVEVGWTHLPPAFGPLALNPEKVPLHATPLAEPHEHAEQVRVSLALAWNTWWDG